MNKSGRSKRKKDKLPKIVAYISLLRWSHALGSDQNSGLPKFAPLVARTWLGLIFQTKYAIVSLIELETDTTLQPTKIQTTYLAEGKASFGSEVG